MGLASAGGQALATNDSAGVVIVGNAREYAANTRLALRIRHARTEALVRAGAFTPASLREIVQVFEPGELKVDLNGRSVPLNLAQLRNHYRLLFEAVIWARLYNFVPNKSPPIRVIGAEFDGIRKDLSDYWRDRFADLLDAWTVQKGKTRFRTVAPGAQIVNLRDYFWEMVQNLPKLRDGELNRRVR